MGRLSRAVWRPGFVTQETTRRILDACPDAEWRLIVALCRFSGVRWPSELLPLRWGEVDWERGRFLVRSPKTEHHEGGSERWVPIFPELRPYMEDAFEHSEPGTVFLINRYRDTNQNLRTQLLRIIRRAGVAAWPSRAGKSGAESGAVSGCRELSAFPGNAQSP